MKRIQRRAHLVLWILLTPFLLFGVYIAMRAVTGP
jgi:hypothetical protein